MDKVLPKKQLLKEIQRFCKNRNRGISLTLFADLSGMSLRHFKDVFVLELHPMTEEVQRRVSRAYEHWKKGEVAVYQNRDHSRFVQFRKEAKPELVRGYGLEFTGNRITLNIGIKNRNDYSTASLDEQLRGEHG